VAGGLIERLPGVPRGVRGRARAVVEAAPLATLPRPDVIWTSAAEASVPYLWSQLGPLRRPLFFDLDGTLEQQEQFAPVYYNRAPKTGLPAALARLRERALWSAVTLFLPWSNWAAASLRRQGVDERRIRVIPPGVDLDQWLPRPEIRGEGSDRLRLLFVGGDFVRKGGNLLLDVFRARFAALCELDIVTRDPVPPVPGVRVHRAEPNSPLLRDLYARADVFVLPTRAEFFGIASVEALASGLPVIASDLGGARDIVDDGETGWLIQPTGESLAGALERALAQRAALPSMGQRGRAIAEQRFDGARNDRLLVDLLLEAVARAARTPVGAPAPR
jgi:glycosyltransferase involved in cell wall biosynthesis